MRYRRDSAGRLDSTYDRRLAERLLRVALSRGITTIRDPGASPIEAALALREAVDSGDVIGPRIFTAGPIISNPKLTESEIRAEVAAQAAAGVNYIKLYAGIGPAQLAAAVDEAHRHRKAGHRPSPADLVDRGRPRRHRLPDPRRQLARGLRRGRAAGGVRAPRRDDASPDRLARVARAHRGRAGGLHDRLAGGAAGAGGPHARSPTTPSSGGVTRSISGTRMWRLCPRCWPTGRSSACPPGTGATPSSIAPRPPGPGCWRSCERCTTKACGSPQAPIWRAPG